MACGHGVVVPVGAAGARAITGDDAFASEILHVKSLRSAKAGETAGADAGADAETALASPGANPDSVYGTLADPNNPELISAIADAIAKEITRARQFARFNEETVRCPSPRPCPFSSPFLGLATRARSRPRVLVLGASRNADAGGAGCGQMDVVLRGIDIKVVDDSGGRNLPILDVSIGHGDVSLSNWSAQKVSVVG